eukprot:307080-Prorocentrum_minimum.AAC.2
MTQIDPENYTAVVQLALGTAPATVIRTLVAISNRRLKPKSSPVHPKVTVTGWIKCPRLRLSRSRSESGVRKRTIFTNRLRTTHHSGSCSPERTGEQVRRAFYSLSSICPSPSSWLLHMNVVGIDVFVVHVDN